MLRTAMEKRPFDVSVALRRIRETVAPFAKAAMFELAERGHRTAFEQLAACIISIRTFDEVMLPAALALFAAAPTPADVVALGPEGIDRIIAKSTFHERKAAQIHAIARRVVDDFGGELPCDEETMLSLSGVGPKCTNLVMGVACGVPRIGVDIHVHRITNRWGYVETSAPERTIDALAAILPEKYWIPINELLVPFGKHVCTGRAPKCSTCPVLDMCQQVGVESHR